ncbi:MAG TPA: hypothetical protein VL418_00975 [Devosiaceae bacterium]|nr:hypothetical protein [Devosiaceae bacterium]
MTKTTVSLLAAAFVVATVPAFAADLPLGVVAAPAPAAAPLNTLTLETDPEFIETPNAPTDGSLQDWYIRGIYSRNLGQGLSGSLAIQNTAKPAGGAFAGGSDQQYYEGALAYRLAVTSDLSFTVTGTLGYTAGNTGYLNDAAVSGSTQGTEGFLYYAINGAADWKVDQHWTWNVINARYRNAFDLTWVTPKVQTGLTYNIDAFNAVYGAVGYAWKDSGNGQGLQSSSYNVAVGYKYSF